MEKKLKLVSTISTGGAGVDFERRIQAFFIIQMINGGAVPTLPVSKITKVLCQGRNHDFKTDDCVVFTEGADKTEYKLLVQCKLSISITRSSEQFSDTMKNAWHDFSNNSLFDKNRDSIALVTGSLNQTDESVLEIFRDLYTEVTFINFWKKFQGVGFSKVAKEKMNVIIDCIKKANNNIRPNDEELFNFLKSFYILKSDLHEDALGRGGINLSLLHTELGNPLYSYVKSPQDIWNGINIYLRDCNRFGNPIELVNLPNDLKELFERSERTFQTKHFAETKSKDAGVILSEYEKELTLLAMIGSFDQKNKNDVAIVEDMFGIDSKASQKILQKLLIEGNMILTDGIWEIKANRKKVIEKFGGNIFDVDIENFKDSFLKVLKEIDPALELPTDKRIMGELYGKRRKYSNILRTGIANGMALIANNDKKMVNCSHLKIMNETVLAIRNLLTDCDSLNTWKNLNDVLRPIAETAPREFIKSVKKAFNSEKKPFAELIKENEDGFLFSNDNLSDLRWALVNMAWDKNYFGEAVLLLAKLADLENTNDVNGHQYTLTSLVEILLPWYPQTMAEPMNRIAAVERIIRDSPGIGWKLLIALLPNKITHSTEHMRPLWREGVPLEMPKGNISDEEYWSQEEKYSELLVKSIKELSQIIEVIQNIDNLTKTALDCFIQSLNTMKFLEDDETVIWNALLSTQQRIKRQISEDMQYSLSNEYIDKINDLVEQFTPRDKVKKYRRLFDKADYELYEDLGDWESGKKNLEYQRVQALRDILSNSNIKELIKLVEEVKYPYQLGIALGSIDGLDNEVLPVYIDEITSHKKFISGYISGRFYRTNPFDIAVNMKWVKNIEFTNWDNTQIAYFLVNLPFLPSVWDILDQQLQDIQDIYWQNISDFRDMSSQGYSDYPFQKLIAAKRPIAALECFQSMILYYNEKKIPVSNIQGIDVSVCCQIMLELLNSKELDKRDIPDSQIFRYNVLEMIDFLQNKLPLNDARLWEIEWNFMPFFDSHNNVPKAVVFSLENNAELFHQMIATIFKSENARDEEVKNEVSKQISENILKLTLINKFKVLPGRNKEGKFESGRFQQWIKEVKKISVSSGHWAVAQDIIGGYLVNAPEDESHLFITKEVAEILDQEENDKMRQGYINGIINSLGVQIMDSKGTTNNNRKKLWNRRADEVEKTGFIRFASKLRELADNFEMDAQRDIIESQKNDKNIIS